MGEKDYYRGDGLDSISRTDLFNPDGSISDTGIEEFARVNHKLEDLAALCGRSRTPGEVLAVYSIWRSNQLAEIQEPGYLSRLPMI